MIDHYRQDPDHQARLDAHRLRIESELPAEDQAEQEDRERQRRVTKLIASVAGKKKAKRVLITHYEYWLAKVDRLNRMAGNVGYSIP